MAISPAVLGQYLVSGLTVGSVYALVAIGFTLVYETCEIVNFAQGEFAMLGAMLAVAAWRGMGLPLPAAALLGLAATVAIGAAVALAAVYPLRRISPLGLIILTIGLAIVLRGGAMLAWGKDARMLPVFHAGPPILIFVAGGAVVLQWQAVWILGAASLTAAGLFFFLRCTNLGRAMRAAASNPRGARLCGIEPRRVTAAAFAISAAVGAIGGIVIAPMTMASYDMGIMLGLKGFCAAVVGGLSSLPGALAGGLVLGILEALGAGLVSSHLKEVLAFVALLGILYLRPKGLFGGRGA